MKQVDKNIVSNAAATPFLSIIIPAYNEERRLPPSLAKIADFLRSQSYTAEVLVVENGSSDRTSAVVEEFIAAQVQNEPVMQVRLLHSSQGKGAAVKHGMLQAQGDYRFICDADLAMPIEEITKFLPPTLKRGAFDVAIASREAPGAIRYDEPAYRHAMGRVFNWLVRIMAVPPRNSQLAPHLTFDAIVGYNALLDTIDKAGAIQMLAPLLAPNGVLVLAERVPRYTQRLHRLIDLTALGADLVQRVAAAEEAIYAAAADPLVNWDEETLRAACGAAGLTATVTVEDETTPTPITPAMLARWFTPTTTDRPSADHLGRLLTPTQVAQVRDLFQRQLAGQQVAWGSRTLLLTGRRP